MLISMLNSRFLPFPAPTEKKTFFIKRLRGQTLKLHGFSAALFMPQLHTESWKWSYENCFKVPLVWWLWDLRKKWDLIKCGTLRVVLKILSLPDIGVAFVSDVATRSGRDLNFNEDSSCKRLCNWIRGFAALFFWQILLLKGGESRSQLIPSNPLNQFYSFLIQ